MTNDDNPTTERTLAIRQSIETHEREARSLGTGLRVVMGLIIVIATGVMILLSLRWLPKIG